MNEPIEIPNKSSFKINEVCALTGIKSYVLRFWESEFSQISPLVSSAGLKLYEHKDIEAILLIKKLLFEEKFSIEKAKSELFLRLPSRPLVEDGFNDYQEDNLSFERDEVLLIGKENNAQTKRVINESDIQKLVLAKSKLSEILNLTEVLNKRNNWR